MPQILESELRELRDEHRVLAKPARQEVEKCWVIFGRKKYGFWLGRLVFLSSGDASNVKFDADDVFVRHDTRQDVLGFLHTHPQTQAYPSATDHATMNAWVSSLGKPLVCAIKGTDGLKSYLYEGDDSEPIAYRVRQLGRFVIGTTF